MAANVSIRVSSDFQQASQDLKKFGKVTEEERTRVEKYAESYKTEQMDKFMTRQARTNAAITATRGPLAAAQNEYKNLQREIERLIKKGIDPQDKALKPLVDRYKQLGKQIDDTAKNTAGARSRFSLLDGVFIGLGASVVSLAKKGFQELKKFTMESAKAASDAQEIFSKYNTIFRDVASDSNLMASQLAKDFGLASSTAAKLIGDTGDLLTGFGLTAKQALELSDETNRLAIDLASFSNAAGGAEAVSKALTSAFSGERQALKTYGIVINETMLQQRMAENAAKGLTFETEQQAKIQATLQIATEQSKNAIGDYARTSESAANVQRRLGEQVKELKELYGEAVLEGLTPFRKALVNIIEAVNQNIRNTRELNKALDAAYGRSQIEDTVDGVLQLERGYEELQKRVDNLRASTERNLASDEARIRAIGAQGERQIAALESQMRAIESQIQARSRLLTQSELSEIAAQREADIAREKLKLEEMIAVEREAAGKELEKRAHDGLSTEEKRVQFLQTEIDRLAGVRASARAAGQEYEVIQRLITDYVKERDKLIKSSEDEKLKDTTSKIVKKIQERLAEERRFYSAVSELESELDERRKANEEAEKIRVQELIALRLEYASSVLGIFNSIDQIQKNMSAAEIQRIEESNKKRLEAAEDQGASEEELAELEKQLNADLEKQKKKIARDEAKRRKKLALFEVGINTAAAISDALPNFILAGLVGIAGAVQAAAIASQPVPTAQTGTGPSGITIPETSRRGDNVAVMAGPGERVDVTPRGESGMTQNMTFVLEGQPIINFINRKIESGEIRITAQNIQGGIAV